MSKFFQIAIDGPVAAGCSIVARLVAERLGFLYIDTGAMYRTAALLSKRHQINPQDENKLTPLVKKSQIELHPPSLMQQDGRLITVILDGEDISWKIRTDEMSKKSAIVAVHPKLRQVLVKKQQEIAASHNVVMEGRDITYKVLPEADIKIYLTASEIARAKRRHIQEQSKGRDISYQEVYQELLARDKQDVERDADPLKIVNDAVVIDSSDLNIDQVVDMIESKVKAMKDVS